MTFAQVRLMTRNTDKWALEDMAACQANEIENGAPNLASMTPRVLFQTRGLGVHLIAASVCALVALFVVRDQDAVYNDGRSGERTSGGGFRLILYHGPRGTDL